MNEINLIAEIGGNHEGDIDYANHLTELALGSAADTIKFQLYSGESIANKKVDKARYEHFKKFELTKSQHIDLAKKCISGGKEYLASVWNKDMLEWIDPFLERYKVGSGDLTNKPLLKEFANRGKPIILSTGLSSMKEVEDTVTFIRSLNPFYEKKPNLVLMQCTSMYPIRNEDANLAVLKSFSSIGEIILGYSDHTEDMEALYASVILGAEVLEFHFTDKREGKDFRDHKVSLIPSEVNKLNEKIRLFFKLLGDETKQPLGIEIENGHVESFRRAVYLKCDIKKGMTITKDMLVTLRPNEGISAWDIDKVIGQVVKDDIEALTPLNLNMFD
tara:strand:+ start:2033 stop:3028 length:996 start_codon:yes stop_codon:yes gene_type:complete